MGETNVKDHQAPKCLHWPRWASHININAMHSALWQRCETPKAGTEYVANFWIGFCLFSSHVIWVKRVGGKTLQKTNHQMNECSTSIYICNPFGIKLETSRALQTENTRTWKHAICTCGYKRNPPVFCLVAFWHGNNIGKQHAIWPKHTETISGQHHFKETLFFEVYFFDAMAFLRNLIAPQRRQKYIVFRPIEKRWQLSQSPRPRRGKPSIMVRN